MTRTGWRTAFIAQGESDLKVFHLLRHDAGVEHCHALHYLQMAAEKVAKGLNCRDEFTRPEETHFALVRWIRHAKANPYARLMTLCGVSTRSQFRAYLHGLHGFAETIELLAPAVARQRGKEQNAEYPWLDAKASTVRYPAVYPFHEVVYNPKYPKFIRFVEASIEFGKVR